MNEGYIPTLRDRISLFIEEHERGIVEIVAVALIIFGLATIGFLITILMGILTGTLAWIINFIYRRALAKIASNTLCEITGNVLEPPPSIWEMHDLIDYFRHVRDTGGELNEENPLYKKGIDNGDVAYQ